MRELRDRETLMDVARPLRGLRGATFWRSLDELAATPRFREALDREFPRGASELDDPISRRDFVRLLGGTLALAGVVGCVEQPRQPIVPYVHAPEHIVPGQPLFFASAMPLAGYGLGVLVESHMGRPTKIEGNPDHPASLGATDHAAQAAVLDLYDPDRSTVPLRDGHIAPWMSFIGFAQSLARTIDVRRGEGFRLLTGGITSPTLVSQIEALLERWPEARWHRFDLALRDSAREATRLVFGEVLDCYYRLDRADVVLALDAELFTGTPEAVRYGRDFAARRRVRAGVTTMNRLYAVGPTPAPTGAMADHRLPLRSAEIEPFARALASELGVPETAAPQGEPLPEATLSFLRAAAADLRSHAGRSVVAAGEYQSTAVHALAHAINVHLGNAGETVIYVAPVEREAGSEVASLSQLAEDMSAGHVEALVMIGGNPVYSAPSDLEFGRKLRRVPVRVHSSLYVDETSALCTWHLPAAHWLESWSDIRAFDGTASIVQPLIRPLYEGRGAHEVLAAFSSDPMRSGYDAVRGYWQRRLGAAEATADERFEEQWRDALNRGVVPDTAAAPRDVMPRSGGIAALSSSSPPALTPGQLEIDFRPDPSIFDGRYANNAWLQELPKPITKITWDNAVLIAPATAERLELSTEDVVELRYRGRRVRGPVFILPGQAQDAVTVHLGFGRAASAGEVGARVGFDANQLRTSDALWSGLGVTLVRTGERHPLATTQLHHMMHGRDFVRAGTFDLFLREPDYPHDRHHAAAPDASLYPEWEYRGEQWGMVIDNTVCTGCNACVVACQAENNVPPVGKEGVARQREMHWLRIDHYYEGDPANPRSFFQPMLCQHCEKAPCEVVCPVAATTHSGDGLNQMIYNRCVGTRYCSNNCPYKVRRFNFFDDAYDRAAGQPTLKMLMNPDVTVRTRGVMEKCTYCVQRISAVRIDARRDGRDIRDGEIVTACQAACPTDAIVFGNINDPGSRVSALKQQPHNYALLDELNTRPRTTYLAAVRNLNDALDGDPRPLAAPDRGHETSGGGER